MFCVPLSVHQDCVPRYLQYLFVDFRQNFFIGASWDNDELINSYGVKKSKVMVTARPNTIGDCMIYMFLQYLQCLHKTQNIRSFSRSYTGLLQCHELISVWKLFHLLEWYDEWISNKATGNSRESATSKIPGGNSREFLIFCRKFWQFIKFQSLVISCCE